MNYRGLFCLEGDVIIVSGGGGGIGSAIALGLSQVGASIAVVDIDDARAQAAADKIKKDGGAAIALKTNVADEQDVESMIGAVTQHFSKIDALVNCVGFNVFRPTMELSLQEWENVLSVNLTSAFVLSRAVARVMASQKRGCIVNFGSVTARFGSPGQCAYAAAKAALVNLTKTLALEWARYNIRVNAISPVMTETPINSSWLNETPDRKRGIVQNIPAGRLGSVEDFVGPVVFLCSRASAFVRGQTIYVDGGVSAVHPLIRF